MTMMGQEILRGLLKEIRDANWFSITTDELQMFLTMNISIQWADHDYIIHGDPLCLVQLENKI